MTQRTRWWFLNPNELLKSIYEFCGARHPVFSMIGVITLGSVLAASLWSYARFQYLKSQPIQPAPRLENENKSAPTTSVPSQITTTTPPKDRPTQASASDHEHIMPRHDDNEKFVRPARRNIDFGHANNFNAPFTTGDNSPLNINEDRRMWRLAPQQFIDEASEHMSVLTGPEVSITAWDSASDVQELAAQIGTLVTRANWKLDGVSIGIRTPVTFQGWPFATSGIFVRVSAVTPAAQRLGDTLVGLYGAENVSASRDQSFKTDRIDVYVFSKR